MTMRERLGTLFSSRKAINNGMGDDRTPDKCPMQAIETAKVSNTFNRWRMMSWVHLIEGI